MRKFLLLPLLVLSLLAQAQPVSLPNLKPYIGIQLPINPPANQRAGATQIRNAFNAVVDQLVGMDSSRVWHQTLTQLRSIPLSASLAPKSVELLDPLRAGLFQLVTGDNASLDDGGMMLVTQSGLRYKRIPTGTGISIKWYGAYGDGIHDDAPAINATIAYCKALASQYFLKSVFIPEGQYLCNSNVNGADAVGLSIVGVPGRSFNSVLILNTGSIGLDMSGSSESCVRYLSLSIPNYLSNPAKVALQFALSKNSVNQATAGAQKGGLNTVVSDIDIRMGDFVGINGGLGGLGLVLCRSEELSLHNITIQANTPVVATTTNNLSTHTGYAYTILSPNIPIQDDAAGSMGVVNWTGQNSLRSWEHETPNQLLNGVNNYHFTGYQTRLNNTTGGTCEDAIRTYQTTANLTVNATVEGFATMLHASTSLENCKLDFVAANATDPTKPFLVLDNFARIEGGYCNIDEMNLSELNNGRMLVYTPAVNNGADATSASIKNWTLTCTRAINNEQVISANLLKQTDNSRFYTATPFEKVGPYVRLIGTSARTLTTVAAGGTTTATLCHFTVPNYNQTVGGGGFTEFKISGVVQAGDYNTGNGPSFYEFEGTILYGQRGDGVPLTPQVTITPKSQLTFNGAYLNITGVNLGLSVSGNVGTVTLTATIAGSGTGEGFSFAGEIREQTNYKVNASILSL